MTTSPPSPARRRAAEAAAKRIADRLFTSAIHGKGDWLKLYRQGAIIDAFSERAATTLIARELLRGARGKGAGR